MLRRSATARAVPRLATPGRLRLAMTLVVLAGLAFGLLGLQGLTGRAAAIDRARAETSDQVRLQTVRTKLVVADAAAGVDVLLGPKQPRLTPHDYAYALQPALINLAIAARQSRDAFPLAVANLRVAQYAGDVESARTLARLGQPQAAESLQRASTALRADVLPRVLAVQRAGADRLAEDERSADRGPLLAVFGALLALLVLVGVHWWLTLRTRRILNLGIGVALLLVGASTVTGAVIVARSQTRADQVGTGPQVLVQSLVDARQAAFDARAEEALGVVTEQGSATETRWNSSITAARDALARAANSAPPAARAEIDAVSGLLDSYAAVHARLHRAAASGDHAQAVAIAVDPTVDGAIGSFEDVDASTGALTARQVQAADDGWVAAGADLGLAGWLCLTSGIGAALLGWRGLAERLREYH